MRLLSALTLFAILAIQPAFACNTSAARNVQQSINRLANISKEVGALRYTWKPFWNKQNDDERLNLITTAANADACLTGRTREIRFYSPVGKLVGIASPSSGIRLIK